jgi:hypothetical protein
MERKTVTNKVKSLRRNLVGREGREIKEMGRVG